MILASALITFLLLCLLFGGLIGIIAQRFKKDDDSLVGQINQILPQTQCGQCGYPGCKPYAKAITEGDDINKCPPGGQAGIDALANLLGRETMTLDESHGVEKPKLLAIIREDECIGCTKCIQACPVDAIIGAPKQMHTVIADACTGCDLCAPVCPVDCIDMEPPLETLDTWQWPAPTAILDKRPEPTNTKRGKS